MEISKTFILNEIKNNHVAIYNLATILQFRNPRNSQWLLEFRSTKNEDITPDNNEGYWILYSDMSAKHLIDYPVLMPDSTVQYNFIHRIPSYIQEWTTKILRSANNGQLIHTAS